MATTFNENEVTEGSIWRSTANGYLAKVVSLSPSTGGRQGLIAEVVYDRGDGQGFKASILPATWFVQDWPERFKPEPTQSEGVAG